MIDDPDPRLYDREREWIARRRRRERVVLVAVAVFTCLQVGALLVLALQS